MSDHANATLVREMFAAFKRGDIAAIYEAIPEDAVWHFPGRDGQIAGTHKGREGILMFLGQVMALTEGTFHLEMEDVIANDRTAIALFRGSAKRNGKELDNPTCLRIDIKDGKVSELREFVWDLYAVDDFWR